MKKKTLAMAMAFMALVLSACGGAPQQSTATATPQPTVEPVSETVQPDAELPTNDDAAQTTGEDSILIVYFTVPETDDVDTMASASRVLTDSGTVGNTQFIAEEIQKNIGGDLFEIKTEQTYPGTHDALLDFAYNEKRENARPALSTHIENLDSYDTVFIGYPNWNADLPMPMYSFFEEYDFSGKTIIPFVTHGGSSFSGTIRTIQNLEPNATVLDAGLSIPRGSVATAQETVKEWTEALALD